MKLRLLICLFTLPLSMLAQDHEWWSNNVNWDGITHWSEYIISAPRFLGPNALPIPLQNKGILPKRSRLEIGGNAHFSEGDNTQNPSILLDYVFVPKKVSFSLYWVPVEFFQVSHEKKTERNVFHVLYDETTASGDIQLQTQLQLLNAEAQFADAVLRIGYRFANSNKQGAARFTDAPGYFFDLGISKKWDFDQWQFRPAIMLGFKVWQTNRDDQFQNDAFLFGLSFDLEKDQWLISSSFRGYLGYLNNGDKAMVWDTRLNKKYTSFDLFIGGGIGIKDNLFNRLEAGIGIFLDQSSASRLQKD